MKLKSIFILIALYLCSSTIFATNYYVHSKKGSDTNIGTGANVPFRTLTKINSIKLKAGDKILLASGITFNGSLILKNISGTKENPIVISSYESEGNNKLPVINSI